RADRIPQDNRGMTMKLVSGLLVGWCLAWGAAHAQGQATARGTTSATLPANLGTRENTISLERVRLTWSFGVLLGEPTYSVTGDYRMPGPSMPGSATLTNASVCTPQGVMPGSKPASLSSKDMPQPAWAGAMR